MNKISKIAPKFAKLTLVTSLLFMASTSFAQSTSGNIVNLATPDQCAAACGRDNMCASWTFKPNPPSNGQSNGGQCQFSRANAQANGGPNSPNFVQPRVPNNVPSWTQSSVPTWSAPNPRGGNYAVTPLPSYAPSQPRVAAATTPMAQPQTTQNRAMTNNGANITFERPQAPVAQPQAQSQQQLVWRPVETPQTQAPAPTQMAANTNLNAYRATDGTVDAAQMRRDQLASQNRDNQPRYSVQGEWSGVASSIANGQNQSGIDWSNTTPIPQPAEENARLNTTANAEKAQTSRGRGPLRSRRAVNTQDAGEEVESAPRKGLMERLGGLFGGGNNEETDQSNVTAEIQNDNNVTAMHGPLRKRANNGQ